MRSLTDALLPAHRRRLENLSPFGLNVRRELAARGLTQADLADKLQVRPQAISQSLRVLSPRLGTVERFAKAIGCKPARLDQTYEVRALGGKKT